MMHQQIEQRRPNEDGHAADTNYRQAEADRPPCDLCAPEQDQHIPRHGDGHTRFLDHEQREEGWQQIGVEESYDSRYEIVEH